MLAELLAAVGYLTRHAQDGLSALQVAEEFEPHVAILDIGLPVMDGYELARRFGEQPRTSQVRLVALTGHGRRQDLDRSLAAGFLAHLVKPVDLAQLQSVLDAVPLDEHPSASKAAPRSTSTSRPPAVRE